MDGQNIDINKLCARYEQEIGSLRGQLIRTEAITEQRLQQAEQHANMSTQQLIEALQVLQEVAAGLKNTNAQVALRKKIEEFVSSRVGPSEPPSGPPLTVVSHGE